MNTNYFKLAFLFFLFFACSYGQKDSPNFTASVSAFNTIEPLGQQLHISPDLTPRVGSNDRWLNFPTNFNALPKGKDPLLNDQRAGRIQTLPPIVNFDGATVGVHSGVTPPDPTGAVGKNHYIHAYNSGFVIYDKSGNILLPHASLDMLFPGETLGDPIVMYDRYADRFVVTQFSNGPNALLIAVSQGPDPVNDGWYTYRYNLDDFPDYPHYAIWHDGYYVTANKFVGNYVYALERDKLIAGDNSAQIVGFTLPGITSNPNTVFAPMGMTSVGPVLPDASLPAYITYLQDDAWAGGVDHLKIWEVDVDWATIGNSTISAPSQLNTTPFDSFTAAFGSGEVPQPGTAVKIDGITGLISYAVNYWNFGTHNSATVNFNVDVNGDNTILGIRWFELREAVGTWSIFQEGTYAPNDGLYRFMGSMCMDGTGNIGLAFSVGNSTTFPSLRYTGRFATSPAGVMDITEQTIVDGGGSLNFNRYGDYAHMTLDPVDNQTFWFASEYVNGPNEWRTRITSFKIAPDAADDVGAIAITSPGDATLSATESITVALFNFGTDPQSNIPVWFEVDGGGMVMENYPGPLSPMTSDTYTFTATADLSNLGQTYSLEASTVLAGDANTTNDPITKQVENLPPNDLGVISINTPESGTGLTANENIEVTVENFGGLAQSNFDVAYSLNGSPVTEQVAGPLNPGDTVDYSFTGTGDLSSFGIYQLSSTTSLGGDFDSANDAVSKTVNHASCIPTTIGDGDPNSPAGCNLDGIKRFVLGTIDIDDGGNGCNSTGSIKGYVDRTNLSTDLDRSAGNNTHVLQSQHNWTGGATVEQLSVWIDFNDNGVFDPAEQLIVAQNYTIAGALNDFDLVIPNDAALGSHILRARGLDPTGIPGDPNDPCADLQYGETHDYIVNIIDSTLSIDDLALNGAEFNIFDRGDNNFEVILKSAGFTNDLVITMHNVLGQKLVKNRVYYENGQYRYFLNLNGLSSGVYLVRIGTNNFGRVKRIIVK